MTTAGGSPRRRGELIKHSKRNRTESLALGQRDVLLKYRQEGGRFESELMSPLLTLHSPLPKC
jgi:hypothetical protein